MLCHHCHAETEEGFAFCPKCGLRLKGARRFFRLAEGQRSLFRGVALALALFAAGLVVLVVRQKEMSKLKQGKRDGLAYVASLAQQAPAVSALQKAIGKPIRISQVSSGRSVAWFRISGGFLGVENAGGFFHLRPDQPVSQDAVLLNYERRTDPVLVAGEWITNYDGPSDLGLTTLANEKRPSALTELIVWRRRSH